MKNVINHENKINYGQIIDKIIIDNSIEKQENVPIM